MNTLPDDLFYIIKSFLDDRSRRIVRAASTKWFNIIQYDSFVFYFTTREQLPQIYQRLGQYKFPIKISFQKPKCHLTIHDYVELCRKSTQILSLNIADVHDSARTEDLLPLTNLTNLQTLDVALPFNLASSFINATNMIYSIAESTEEVNLMNLTKLQSVRFSVARGSTTLPRFSFASTNNLTKLETYFNPTTAIDEDNWKRLSNLKELIVTGSFSTDRKIPPLPNLEKFYISSSNIEGFESLPKLTSLTVGRYNTINTSTFSTLTALKSFEIHWRTHNLEGLTFMTALTNLEELTFGVSVPTGENLLQFFNSSKVTALELAGDLPIHLMNLNVSNVRKLRLTGPRTLTPDLMRNFTSLTELRLDGAIRVDQLFPAIETLKNLKALHITGDYREAPLKHYDILKIQELTALEVFAFYGFPDKNTHIYDALISHLLLKDLTIGWPVDDEFFEEISKITSLERLCFYDASQLSNEAIELLISLSNLTRLALFGTDEKISRDALTRVTTLQCLDVHPNGPIPEEEYFMKRLPYLYRFNEY